MQSPMALRWLDLGQRRPVSPPVQGISNALPSRGRRGQPLRALERSVGRELRAGRLVGRRGSRAAEEEVSQEVDRVRQVEDLAVVRVRRILAPDAPSEEEVLE